MSRFPDHVVWITGGGSGIGRALALALAREGACIAVSGRRRDRLDEVVAAVEAVGRPALAVPCDVAADGALEDAVAAVVARFGRLDVAIANAGFSVSGRNDDLRPADWRRQLETNVVALAETARVALPHLRATQGRLVLIGSVAGYVSFPGHGPYQASKAAVRAIGETLWLEEAATGVAVTTIHPGFVHSEIGRIDRQGVHRPDAKDRRPSALLWQTDDAADVMVRAISRKRRDFVFTAHGRLGAWFARHLPGTLYALFRWLTRTGRLPAR
jgi:NAD(P)-dependent dehydrogenase (short-subunit alcohol dehydrogenase family)